MRRGVETSDLVQFQEALRTALEDLTGVAILATIEDQVEIKVDLGSGTGTLEGRVEDHAFARVEFEGVRTDQTFLQSTLAELRKATSTRPVKP